jgi:hypothetical protein
MALDERIDAIGKKTKTTRRKRQGDDDVDVSLLVGYTTPNVS